MVLVVRGELRLTAGKAAVQVAHAAVMLVESGRKRYAQELDAWFAGGQKKIAVVTPNLDGMEGLLRVARAKGFNTAIVEDAGLTEVAPGTKTVLGIGPAKAEEIDAITGDLDLL